MKPVFFVNKQTYILLRGALSTHSVDERYLIFIYFRCITEEISQKIHFITHMPLDKWIYFILSDFFLYLRKMHFMCSIHDRMHLKKIKNKKLCVYVAIDMHSNDEL